MFEDGDAYQRFMGRWSDRVAASFVADLHVPDECWWLDVGCGSGALLAAVLHARRPARLTGLDPSPAQLALARRRLSTAGDVSAELVLGSADAVPLADGVVDAVVTGLVLNFCPDPGSALAELVRVTRPGGTVAGYVWDYRHPGFFLRRYWEAADLEGVLGNADERHRWPVCTDDGMAALLAVHPGAVQGPSPSRPPSCPTRSCGTASCSASVPSAHTSPGWTGTSGPGCRIACEAWSTTPAARPP